MATIKKFNSENFNVKAVDAKNFKEREEFWTADLNVEVTDKETGVKVYDTVLKNRVVFMLDTSEDWYEFIQSKIEDGVDIDEDIEYYDADKELQKEFDDMIEEQYTDWFLEGLAEGNAYEFDEEDLAEIFDEDCYNLVIIDGDKVWFTDRSKWDEIGYNADTENEVYECDEYIIEETGWNTYVIREKNNIKIIKDLFENING